MYAFETGYPGARNRLNTDFHEWAMVVGDRVRRLRKKRGWTLIELARAVRRPDGGRYSPGYFSKLERGLALAPLVAYLQIADAFEVAPGHLLGADDAFKQLDPAEATLLDVVRQAGLTPADAIVRILGRDP